MKKNTVFLFTMATALGCYNSSRSSVDPEESVDTEDTGDPEESVDTEDTGGARDSADTESDETDSETPPLSRCTTEEMIDDMEDGSGEICAADNRTGVWYAFNDSIAEQFPPATEPGVPIEIATIPGGRDGSTRAIHTYGKELINKEESYKHWGAGIGIDLAYKDDDYRLYDGSAYKGISFWARSDTEETIEVRISTADTTLVEWGGRAIHDGVSECWFEPHSVRVSLRQEWMRYEVFYSQLKSACFTDFRSDELTNIQFYWANQPSNFDPTLDFDFWIDDISFVSEISCCENSPPECEDDWPFADPVVAAAVTEELPSSEMPLCEALCFDPYLSIWDADITSLGGLECYYWMTRLALARSTIADISALSALTELEVLDLRDSELESIAPISGLTKLQRLDLSNTLIGDITPVAALDKLTELNATNTDIDDLNALSGLINLQSLYLRENRIEDLSPLVGLQNLRSLTLSNNVISDLSPLVGLQNLRSLTLSNNVISDLSPLEDLAAADLVYLDLSNNNISDLTPLVNVAFSDELEIFLTDNPIDCESQAENIEALKTEGITVWTSDCP